MSLEKRLEKRKSEILKKWYDQVVDTYPPETALFLREQKDAFSNPVGKATRDSLHALLGELLKPEMDSEAVRSHLDPIVRIRAVQAMFTPSQAAGFVYFLKDIIREVLGRELNDADRLNRLLAFERRIDDMSMSAFDIYMKCREAVFQMKANQEKNKIYKAFLRAGLVEEIPGDEPENHKDA
ncbi:MAG: RsbRD N-terminal domain-containing protein [Thermodesulfobacteriota bacterium]